MKRRCYGHDGACVRRASKSARRRALTVDHPRHRSACRKFNKQPIWGLPWALGAAPPRPAEVELQISRWERANMASEMSVKVIPASQMMLLPPAPDKCQECAVKHDPSLPHDKTSLFYQVKFSRDNGRSATWDDAMAHCDEEMRAEWMIVLTQECAKRGISV